MRWTREQQQRLTAEKRLIDRYFPTFRWDVGSDQRLSVGGTMSPNGSGERFTVWIPIQTSFPYSPPLVLIPEPKPLLDHRGRSLAARGVDASMHLLNPKDGMVSICHTSSDRWSPTNTLYRVFVKARLWLEAYAGHLRTGEPIDYFLHHQRS